MHWIGIQFCQMPNETEHDDFPRLGHWAKLAVVLVHVHLVDFYNFSPTQAVTVVTLSLVNQMVFIC